MKDRSIPVEDVKNFRDKIIKPLLKSYQMGDEKFKNKIIHMLYDYIRSFGQKNRSGLWTVGYKKQGMEAEEKGLPKPQPQKEHWKIAGTGCRYALDYPEVFLADTEESFEKFYDLCEYLDDVIYSTADEGKMISGFSIKKGGNGYVHEDFLTRYKICFEKGKIKFYKPKVGYITEFPKELDYFNGISKEHHKEFWKKYTKPKNNLYK